MSTLCLFILKTHQQNIKFKQFNLYKLIFYINPTSLCPLQDIYYCLRNTHNTYFHH